MWSRIPDRTRFNWKQERRRQVRVWGGAHNEKMNDMPTKVRGWQCRRDTRQGGHVTRWKAPWESWAHEDRQQACWAGEAEWKRAWERGTGGKLGGTPLHTYKDWLCFFFLKDHTLLSVKACVFKWLELMHQTQAMEKNVRERREAKPEMEPVESHPFTSWAWNSGPGNRWRGSRGWGG